MKNIVLTLLLVFTAAAGYTQPAPTLDMLVADVQSGDDGPRQARARQLLPLRGPEAARKMLPLLDDARAPVSFTALRILEDVIHETGCRGDAAARQQVAEAVFSLVAPGTSDKQKEVGLRLLPFVATGAHALYALAVLLADETWREPARQSLETIRTRNALAVLCNALDTAEESFKIDLLRAIAMVEPGAEAGKITPLLEDASPGVQAAALRTLARTGDPALLPDARRICGAAIPESAFDAWDGWLRLTDALAARGGCWETAMQSYREILNTAPYTLVQSGAITGMGRYGDDGCIPVIAKALARAGGDVLEPAALEAFHALSGRAARVALAKVYPEVSTTMKFGLLARFGEAYAPEYSTVLVDQARSEDPVIRAAAREALGQSASPEALHVFRTLLEEAYIRGEDWNAELDAAVQHLCALARHLQQAGDGNNAGLAWLVVYRSAKDEAIRAEALEGIRANPVPEAFDVVLELLQAGDIESLPVDAMVGIAQNAIQAGREAEGRKLMEELIPKLNTPEAVRSVVGVLRGRGPNPEFARAIGVVNHWYFVGPFPWKVSEGFQPVFINEPNISLDASYTVEENTLEWHAADSADAAGLFDLFGVIGQFEQSVAFAYTRIETADGGPAQICTGSDDGIRVWLNGEVVLEKDVDRGYDVDQDRAEITLKPGENTLLVQITQRAGGWAFGLRITRPDGTPFPFTIVP